MSKKLKNTGTKSTKSPGNEYWINAAKQFAWPINHENKTILVPEIELKYAMDDLMVQHFRNNGWHIQSCISVIHTKVFVKPLTPGPIFRGDIKPQKVEVEAEFKCDQKFKIASTGVRVMICEITKKSIVLQYMDTKKDDIITTSENLGRSVRMGVFVRI